MTPPIALTFDGIDSSDWIEREIRSRAAKLDRYCRGIIRCRVVAAMPHRRHEVRNRFDLRIDLAVPGEKIAVALEGQDIAVVIHEAFTVVRRRLQTYTRKHRLESAIRTAARRRAARPARA